MKNFFLSLAFVFVGSITFASSNMAIEEVATDCIGLAFDVDEALGGIDFDTFEAIVDACEAQQ